ncbi:ribosomal RNA-processing protein 9 [[Candida] railenensis]|uniref:Ribosomal RNA-processing protein 9 n=1 Tax=[Candida] railenensis TaxID=45579 RepID=A0A9P0QS78_9ASCO|nr:ribosomal RNA-processing protein 9 [[Candida] railenensis]
MAGDPFLSDPSKKRKRPTKQTSRNSKSNTKQNASRSRNDHDEEISGASDTDDEPGNVSVNDDNDGEDGRDSEELSSDEEFADENAADKRRRLAKQYLENLKQNEFGGAEDDDEFFDAQDLDDDILSRRLQTDVAEQKGYVYKFIGEKVGTQLEDLNIKTTRIGSKNLTSMAIRAPFVYTVSKDCELIKWKIDNSSNKIERIKHTKGGSKKFMTIKNEQRLNHHCDHILCVAASPDGKYVVTGGADGRLIIWSSENLSCLKVLETRSAINSIVFRRGTDQLYAACSDLRIRTYSINQFAQLEVLYGHQDNVTEVSCLSRETCVSVGSRDKTALFWKIAEESRLTFRGGDSTEKRRKRRDNSEIDTEGPEEAFHAEGSIEVVSMIDESHFVTGSDNGNLALWSLAKKKALFTKRLSHGLKPTLTQAQASAEVSHELAQQQVPEPLPYWITAIHAVPFSDIFVTGSYNGCLKVWKLDQEGLRSFQLIGEINNINGCVVKIDHVEIEDKKVTICALTSKEHKLGRWFEKIDGARNSFVSFTVDV